jgi:hypothetical protein
MSRSIDKTINRKTTTKVDLKTSFSRPLLVNDPPPELDLPKPVPLAWINTSPMSATEITICTIVNTWFIR